MSGLVNQVCGGNSSQPSNLGGKNQCIEGAVITGYLAKNDFSFASIADAKNKTLVLAAIKAKNLVPLPEFETVEDENTEATVVEKRTKTVVSKEGVAGSKYGIDAAMCTYAALKTYQNSEYTRIFEITDSANEEMTCDIDADGKVFGRKLNSTIVGLRSRTSLENDASVPLSLKFKSDEYSIILTGGAYADIEGVFDVALSLVSATATEIKFKVATECTDTAVASLQDGDVVLKDDTGAVHAIAAFTDADADNVYAITGVDFANDFTLELNGVVMQGEKHYEAATPLTISGIV